MRQLKAGLTHEDIYKRFGDRFKDLAKDIMEDVISDYLPHAESDLDSNVYYRAMDYISGEYDEKTMYGSAGKRFRQNIFEENKESLITQLNQDLLEENERLKAEVAEWKTAFYRR